MEAAAIVRFLVAIIIIELVSEQNNHKKTGKVFPSRILVVFKHSSSFELTINGYVFVFVQPNAQTFACFAKMQRLMCYINKIQQDATVFRYLFTAKSLYVFRVSIAPIIRST